MANILYESPPLNEKTFAGWTCKHFRYCCYFSSLATAVSFECRWYELRSTEILSTDNCGRMATTFSLVINMDLVFLANVIHEWWRAFEPFWVHFRISQITRAAISYSMMSNRLLKWIHFGASYGNGYRSIPRISIPILTAPHSIVPVIAYHLSSQFKSLFICLSYNCISNWIFNFHDRLDGTACRRCAAWKVSVFQWRTIIRLVLFWSPFWQRDVKNC